jgi:hypothetical protein
MQLSSAIRKQKYFLIFEKNAAAYQNADAVVANTEVVGSAPGVDVMITIFCDFCQFSAKKLACLSKTNVMIQFLHNLALF